MSDNTSKTYLDCVSEFYNLTERDFPEDFIFENGRYQNTCIQCKQLFMGFKRKLTCKVCENDNKRKI